LVAVQTLQGLVQRLEAGARGKDEVELRLSLPLARGREGLFVALELGIQVPDLPPNRLQILSVQVVEWDEEVDQALGRIFQRAISQFFWPLKALGQNRGKYSASPSSSENSTGHMRIDRV
jgi:hypothetical protein